MTEQRDIWFKSYQAETRGGKNVNSWLHVEEIDKKLLALADEDRE